MRTDLFKSDFKIKPTTVTIVGSGANGIGCYHRIPHDSFKIACNASIGITSIHYDGWMVIDKDCVKHEWFQYYDVEHDVIRFYNSDLPGTKIASYDPAISDWYDTYNFIPGKPIQANHFDIREGVIRGGVTVCGCAIQLAYLFGNREGLEICLCGIDMEDNRYFDDSVSGEHDSGKVWDHKQPLDNMIHWIINRGVRVYSVSKTALAVEEVLDE